MIILETERLLLRRLSMGDLDDLFSIYSDPDVRRYFPKGALTRDETAEELEWFAQGGDPEHPALGLWAAIRKDTGTFIGRCGLLPWTIDGTFEVEIAYLLAKDHWRQGLGAEAACALVHYGLHRLGMESLIALIDPENLASKRTAMKAGLCYDRDIEHDGSRCELYRIHGQTGR